MSTFLESMRNLELEDEQKVALTENILFIKILNTPDFL